MSDIPPPVEDQGPKASEPRVRGSRAGKSARRKRQAWQRWVFSQSEGSDLYSDPDAVPFRRPDGTSREKRKSLRFNPRTSLKRGRNN